MWLFSRKKKEEKEMKPERTANLAESRRAEEKVASDNQQTTTVPAVKLPKGEDAYSYQVILRPIVAEKGGFLEKQGKYLFKVAENVNKVEIKKAIEKLYKVKVEKVHILNMPSKFRQVGKHEGRRPGFKKAIVTLKHGDKIEVAA